MGGGPFSLSFYYLYMIDKAKAKYIIESLNVGGMSIDKNEKNLAGKRSTIFKWVKDRHKTISNKIWLFQETNSPINTRDVMMWEKQWGCKIYLNSSHEQNKGVGIFPHPSLNLEISTEHEPVMPQFGVLAGRLIAVTFKIGGEWVTPISVYAPTGSANKARTRFMKAMITATAHLPNRVYGGDWNYIDNPVLDRSVNNSTYGTLGGEPWKRNLYLSGIVDPYRVIHPEGRAYSHSSPTLSNRIDRFYVDPDIAGWVSDVTHHHCPLSHDHKLVAMHITTDEMTSRGNDRWFFNNAHLLSPTFIDKINTLIDQYESDHGNKDEIGAAIWLDNLLAYLKLIIIAHSTEVKSYKDKHLKHLEALHISLANSRDKMNPPTPLILHQIKVNRLQIESHLRAHTYGAKIRSRSRFSSAFEQPSRSFFQMAKARGRASTIEAVRDDSDPSVPVDDRPVFEDQEGKQDVFTSYYKKLFSSKIVDPHEMSETAALLSTISPEQAKQCEGKMTAPELYSSLCTFHNNKSPGPDGFGCEFWKAFWPKLASHLMDACNDSYDRTSLSPLMSSGYISLLFKKDDKKDVKKYRPLTLLSFHYKILTKALTLRLARVITSLCDPSQTGFIAGRYIMENIRLVLDTIDHCEDNMTPAYWIMLDFEKAYDRVSWVYLHACFKMAGFGREFRRWLTTLYPLDPTDHPNHYLEIGIDLDVAITYHHNVVRMLVMNGHATDSFSLHCGVAQGCPLSCLIFVLCVEPLHIMIRSEKAIPGLLLPMPTAYDPMGSSARREQCVADLKKANLGNYVNVKTIKLIVSNIKKTRQDHSISARDKKISLDCLNWEHKDAIKEGKKLDTQVISFNKVLDEIPDKEGRVVKSAGYADDTSVILTVWSQVIPLLSIISIYERATGALNNKDKMVVIPVGGAPVDAITEIKQSQIVARGSTERYLGAQAGTQCEKALTTYWKDSMTNKIVQRLRAWQSLSLSLVGRVMIIKTMALSLIWFHVACMAVPHINKTFNRIIHTTSSYVWKSSRDDCSDSRKRVAGFANKNISCLPWRLGGIGMCDPLAQIGAIRAKWIRMLCDPSTSLWKDLAWHAIHLAGRRWGLGKLILSRPPSPALFRHIKQSIGSSFPFWADVLIDWLKLKPQPIDDIDINSYSYEMIIAQPLWFNPHITINSKMLAWGDWCPEGNNRQSYHTIGDIWDRDTIEFVTQESVAAWLSDNKLSASKLQSLISALPPAWTDTLHEGIQPFIVGDWVMVGDGDGMWGRVVSDEEDDRVGVQWSDPSNPQSNLFLQPAALASHLQRAQVTHTGDLLAPTSISTFDPTRIGWDLEGGNLIPLSQFTVRLGHTLTSTIHPKASTKIVQRKWQVRFNWHRFDWEQVWARLASIKVGKYRAFQWKVLHAVGRFQFIIRTACCPHCDPLAVDPAVTAYHAMFICPVAVDVWRWVGSLWKHIHGLTISLSTPYLLTGLQPPSSVPIILRSAWDLIHLTTLHTTWYAWCRWVHDEIAFTSVDIISSIQAYLCVQVPAMANLALLQTITMPPLTTQAAASPPPTPLVRFKLQWGSTLTLCHLTNTYVYSYTSSEPFVPVWHSKEPYRHQRPQAWMHAMATIQNPDIFQPKYKLIPYIPPPPD